MPKDRSIGKTAKELLSELLADPAYAARRREEDQRIEALREKYIRDESPIVQELRSSGFDLHTLNDLRRVGMSPSSPEVYLPFGNYYSAMPILMKWLPVVENPDVKETIIRTLSVPWASPAVLPMLLEEFRHEDQPLRIRDAAGNGLRILADDSVFDDIVALAADKRYGVARNMLIRALGNMRNPRAIEVLVGFLADDEVAGSAVTTLGALGARSAKASIERLSDHPQRWVQEEVKRVLSSWSESKR